jgi:hypothetical protein
MPSATKPRLAGLLFGAWLACTVCHAQDLTPRAYVITPVRWNAVILTYSFYDGSVLFPGSVPITGATARVNIPIFSYYHALNFFGRSANITASLPYGVGHYRGTVIGAEHNAYRSGLLDAQFRFSVNLKGGPALSPKEFRSWRQKTIIGASVTLVTPTGQYDATRLINQGSNRWAFKPELGLSQRWGHWIADAYAGVWFYTTNPEFFSHNEFFPGTNTQTQKPMGAVEAHLSYNVKNNPRFWFSLDGNYWYGGRTSLNGVENLSTLQANSRVGVTASVPISKKQSLKFSYSDGAITRFGGSYQNVSVAWQYGWVGRRARSTLP